MDNFNLYQDRLLASRKISKSRLSDTKVKTFKRALESSYNAELVQSNQKEFKALVSGIPTLPKIDRKNFATLADHGCEVGDYVYWPSNNSHWLISNHDSTETSIFQGSMQKAIYELKWKDPILDEVYSARACVKGPDETIIGEGVKHAIQFDVLTNSLFLMVSAKVKGIHLLKRYFELIVNGKKWHIEVIDDFTDPNLVSMQLLETPFNRDTDTGDLAGGKEPVLFTVQTALDNLSTVGIGTTINFEPVLFRNGSVIPSGRIKIMTTNSMLNGNLLVFNELGLTSVIVKFEDYNKTFTWNIEVLAVNTEQVIVQEILGSNTIKTLGTNNYVLINTLNGVTVSEPGVWTVDFNFFTVVSEDIDSIKLKAKNKTGTTRVRFVGENIDISKDIKVIPLFGGN